MAQPPQNLPSAKQQPIRGNAEISSQIGELDGFLAKLKIRFEQYFLGIERRPPTDDLNKLRGAVMNLRRAFTNNTALKFRIDTLFQKFKTYEQLWLKTMKEIEEGTYRKDLMRLRLQNLKKSPRKESVSPNRSIPNFDEDELDQALDDALGGFMDDAPSLDSLSQTQTEAEALFQTGQRSAPPPPHPKQTVAGPAAQQTIQAHHQPFSSSQLRGGIPHLQTPGIPQPQAASRPVSRGNQTGLSDARVDEIYRAYIQAKRQCNENTSGITRDALASSLKARVRGDSDVKVIIRGGKAMLSLVKKG